RDQAVAWLADEYDRDPAARDLLRQALQSRHARVAEGAALELARKNDPAAFDAPVQLLNAAKEEGSQGRPIEELQELGDPRAAGAFLDRIENDPEGTALAGKLFEVAGSFRRPEIVDRLLRMAGKEPWREAALQAAYVVSGFDQMVEDPEDKN